MSCPQEGCFLASGLYVLDLDRARLEHVVSSDIKHEDRNTDMQHWSIAAGQNSESGYLEKAQIGSP